MLAGLLAELTWKMGMIWVVLRLGEAHGCLSVTLADEHLTWIIVTCGKRKWTEILLSQNMYSVTLYLNITLGYYDHQSTHVLVGCLFDKENGKNKYRNILYIFSHPKMTNRSPALGGRSFWAQA